MRRGVLAKPEEFNVTIQPVFYMDKKYGTKIVIIYKQCKYSLEIQRNFNNNFVTAFFFVASKAKIEFNKRLTLIPSESWIQCGSFLDLCYSARSLVVKVDPTGLPPGVHAGKYVYLNV